MLSKTTTFLFLCLLSFVFSQSRIRITDFQTGEAISYAKIIFSSGANYRNTEIDGNITINKDENISEIEAFGYETLTVTQFKNTYFLKPKVINIEEVEIFRAKKTLLFTEGKIKREIPSFSFIGNNKEPRTVLSLFFFKNTYPETTFIQKLRFLSDVNKTGKNAKIKLVFYENISGKPSEEIWKMIITDCKPGKNITEIDLSKNPFVFPKEGIFIGFEWIINEENYYPEKVTLTNREGKTEKTILHRTNPSVFSQKTDQDNIWISNKSNEMVAFNISDLKWYKTRKLSIELDLSN